MQLNNAGLENPPQGITRRMWRKIEARFRLWSFHIYYNRSFATEIDPTLRFIKALVASSQPIRDREAVIEWYRQRQENKAKHSKDGAQVDHGNAQAISA